MRAGKWSPIDAHNITKAIKRKKHSNNGSPHTVLHYHRTGFTLLCGYYRFNSHFKLPLYKNHINIMLEEKQNMLCMLENSVPTVHLTFFCYCRGSEHWWLCRSPPDECLDFTVYCSFFLTSWQVLMYFSKDLGSSIPFYSGKWIK